MAEAKYRIAIRSPRWGNKALLASIIVNTINP